MNRILCSTRTLRLLVCALIFQAAQSSTAADITMDQIEEKIRKTDRPEAPDFDGALAWINAEKPLTIADLKGKIVLLDFWTFG